MKIKTTMIALSVSLSVLLSGCYGSFSLLNKAYDWNMGISDNKFVKEGLFLGMVIIPVYGICTFVDAVFLNSIEFWTGSNPISMEEGEEKINTIVQKGEEYTVITTKNNFEIINCEGDRIAFNYQEDEKAWYLLANGEKTKLSSLEYRNGKRLIRQHFPDGSSKVVNI